METAKIFNVIYSDVSEDIKNAVLDIALYEMGPELSFTMLTEDYSDGLSEMLTDYVDIVAHNAVSEEDLDEALEQVLEAVDTDTINIIAESFMDREVRRALFEREETINELFGFGKKSAERTEAENALKAQKATAAQAGAGLKSALANQKAHLKAIKNARPIGLAGLNRVTKTENGAYIPDSDRTIVGKARATANREANAYRIAKQNLNDIKNKERREAIDKVKGAAKSVWNKFTGAVKKGAEVVKNKAIETKDKAVGAVKTGVETAKNKATEVKNKAEGAIRKGVANAAGAVASGATKVAAKANDIKAKAEAPKKAPQADAITKSKADLEAERDSIKDFLNSDGLKGYQKRYYGNKLKSIEGQLGANEALTTALDMIAASTISEEAFMDIMEVVNLGFNKKTINGAVARAEGEDDKNLNKMHEFVKNGQPIPNALKEKTLKDSNNTTRLKAFREKYQEKSSL